MHQQATTRPLELGQSVFHYDLTSDVKRAHLNECAMSMNHYSTAMTAACEAGSRAVAVFASALAGTSYAQSAVQMHGAVQQVEDIVGAEMKRMRQTLETNWAQLSRSSAAAAATGVRGDGTAVGGNKDVEFIGGSANAGNFAQTSLHPHHPSPAHHHPAQQSQTVQSNNHLVDQKVKVGGGGLRSFLSQFGGAKRSDSQSSFYVPLDDGFSTTTPPSTCGGEFESSASVAGVAMTTVDQSRRTSSSGQSTGVTSPSTARTKREETKCIPSNANQFATQEDLDKVINMLSRSSSSNAPPTKKTADNSVSPTKTHHQQQNNSVLHSTYAAVPPQHLNSLLRHHPSENGSDSRLGVGGGIQAVQSSENRSVQHPTPHAPHPPTSNIHGGGGTTNTWPYRPHEQSMWTGSDMLAMQSIFGRVPVDASHGSASSSKSASIDAHRGGTQATFTWPSNLNRFGGFGGNDPSTAVNLQRMYEGNNPWSSNRGGSFGTGDAWGSYFRAWNTDSRGAGTRGVSTVADSSSCSDESSNGESIHWSASTVQLPHQARRRHSSGESGFPALLLTAPAPDASCKGVTPANPPACPDSTSHSWRDTPRHHHAPLAQSSSVIGDRSKMVVGGGGHRALSMQYSDPTLNNRKSLSCWDRGATVGDKPQKTAPDSGVGTMNISRTGGEMGGSGGRGDEHLDKPF